MVIRYHRRMGQFQNFQFSIFNGINLGETWQDRDK